MSWGQSEGLALFLQTEFRERMKEADLMLLCKLDTAIVVLVLICFEAHANFRSMAMVTFC